jgi:hypothetical protein
MHALSGIRTHDPSVHVLDRVATVIGPCTLQHICKIKFRQVDSNPTEGIDIWCVYAFILCLCCPVFR